jgi:hypothetical protein
MIRNLHMLMALLSENGEITFAAKRAEFIPIEGLRIYFPSNHQTRLEKVEYWLKRLHRDPVDWIRPSEEAWTIDIDGAKTQFSSELAKSYPYSSDVSWPRWLHGSVVISPELETGKDFAPRLAFLLTELAVSKAKAPSPQLNNMAGLVVNHFIAGDYHMSSDQYHVSGQVGAVGPNANAEGNTFIQQWAQSTSSLDFQNLAAELALLRAELRTEAQEIEHDQALASVASAELAAKQNDGPTTLKHLKSAGKWALDTATKIGTTVAAKAIQNALGIP